MTNLQVIRSGPRENAGDHSYERIEFRRSTLRLVAIGGYRRNAVVGIIPKLLSNAVVHALDAFLAALLSPVLVWQWLSKHDYLMIIIKVVIEVILELVMLIVFAGVSILTAAALIFDDVNTGTIHQTKYRSDLPKSSSSKEKINEEISQVPKSSQDSSTTPEKGVD